MLKLAFVVGVARSGTTWAWGLLTSHPDVVPLVREDFDPSNPSVVNGMRLTSETSAFSMYPKETIRAVIDKKLEQNPGKLIVEKTPRHIAYIKDIWELYPDARIVHLKRDARAVIASKLHSTFTYFNKDVAKLITDYRSSMEKVAPHLSDPRLITVHYEALLQDPVTQVERLFAFLNLGTEQVLKIIEENRGRVKVSLPGVYRKGKADSWHQDLTKEQAATIESELRPYTREP